MLKRIRITDNSNDGWNGELELNSRLTYHNGHPGEVKRLTLRIGQGNRHPAGIALSDSNGINLMKALLTYYGYEAKRTRVRQGTYTGKRTRQANRWHGSLARAMNLPVIK